MRKINAKQFISGGVTCGVGTPMNRAPVPDRLPHAVLQICWALNGNRTSLPLQARAFCNSGLSRGAYVAHILPDRATLESRRTCAECRRRSKGIA